MERRRKEKKREKEKEKKEREINKNYIKLITFVHAFSHVEKRTSSISCDHEIMSRKFFSPGKHERRTNGQTDERIRRIMDANE